MGFWTTLLERMMGVRFDGGPTAPSSRSAEFPDGSATAVATLDPPSDPAEDRFTPVPPEIDAWWIPSEGSLKECVSPERPDLSPEARALENLLISLFDGHDLNLPPLLNVAERVLIRLRDSKCSLPDVARDLSNDQVIAAAVLRMANSPLYRGLNRITSLPIAVGRLGVQALRTLMMRESLRSAMFNRKRDETGFAKSIWRRSLASAAVMQALSRFTRIPGDDAALYGLLHDIGNVIVLRVVVDRRDKAGLEIDEEAFDFLCHECHQEFGELIANSWKLPADMAGLIADHHSYPAEDDPLRTERLQLQVSDMICSLLGYAPYAPYDLLNSRAALDLILPGERNFTSFLAELPETIEEAIGS